MSEPAILALADGSIWRGYSVGAQHQFAIGEIVFNTAMSGYQEIITDPSYAQQIVVFSYPHIGNVGCNAEDNEASKVYAAGIIVRDLCSTPHNWRQQQSLTEFLKKQQIVAIAGLDTRALVKKITAEGAQRGCIMAGVIDESLAVERARSYAGLEGVDLASKVSTLRPYSWTQGKWDIQQGYQEHLQTTGYHIVVYDFGVKLSILRSLYARDCRVTVVPALTTVDEVVALQPDGIVLSNGPGDPAACDYAIIATQRLLELHIPLFGICLGHQILALACGLRTEKMKFGHHGANHPIQHLASQKIMITSQNHGFTVAEPDMTNLIQITHRSLFDGSIQGLKHTLYPAIGVQGHPEASPGPHDSESMFDDFMEVIQQSKIARKRVSIN